MQRLLFENDLSAIFVHFLADFVLEIVCDFQIIVLILENLRNRFDALFDIVDLEDHLFRIGMHIEIARNGENEFVQ